MLLEKLTTTKIYTTRSTGVEHFKLVRVEVPKNF